MSAKKSSISRTERVARAKRGFVPIPKTMVVIYRRVEGKSRAPHLAKKLPKTAAPDTYLAVAAKTVGEALEELARSGADLRGLDISVPAGEQHQTWRSLAGFTPAGRDLSRCILTRNDLGKCPNWRGANVRDAVLGQETLARDIDATGARFDGSSWERVNASGSCFEGASFVGAALETVDMSNTVWFRPPQDRIIHDLEVSQLLPGSLPDQDPFAYSQMSNCRWKGAIFAPEMLRARRLRRAEVFGGSLGQGVKGAVTSPPALVLGGAALNQWGGDFIRHTSQVIEAAKDFMQDPANLLPSMFHMLPAETAGGALAIGFAIGASALLSMGAHALKSYASEKWEEKGAPKFNSAWAKAKGYIRSRLSEEVIEKLNYLLLSRSKRVVRELQAAMERARDKLPGVFCAESGMAFRVDDGYVILCEAPHLEAAQYELTERLAGRTRGAREGAVCVAFPEIAGTSAPVAILWHADGRATVAVASNSGKRMQMIHYAADGAPLGVYNSANGSAMATTEMAEKGITMPPLKEMVHRLHTKIEEVLARTPTSERAPSLLKDERLDLEYDPATHFAACSGGRVVIRSRATGQVDNPIDYAVATVDPRTGNAAFLTAIDGSPGPRLHAKKGQPRPALKTPPRLHVFPPMPAANTVERATQPPRPLSFVPEGLRTAEICRIAIEREMTQDAPVTIGATPLGGV